MIILIFEFQLLTHLCRYSCFVNIKTPHHGILAAYWFKGLKAVYNFYNMFTFSSLTLKECNAQSLFLNVFKGRDGHNKKLHTNFK